MTVDIRTLLLVIVLMGAVLAVSVAVVAHQDQRDGMRYWAVGLALHIASYVFFSQVGTLGQFVGLFSAVLLRASAWALFAEGLFEFYRRPAPRVLVWAPVVAQAVAFVVLFEHPAYRSLLVSLISLFQAGLALGLMLQARRQTPGHGQYFLMTGLVMAMALLTFRMLEVLRAGSVGLRDAAGTNPVQVISLLGALVTLVLLSIGFVLMSKDRADDQNRQLATQDELTGLANRRHLNKVLTQEWARFKRSKQPFAVVMIDIDFFKPYNDHYGHLAGDECLRHIAQVIQSGMRRAGDLAARYGGEEFLLILPNTLAEDGQRLADAVRQSVEQLNLPHAKAPLGRLTVSMGVAAMVDGGYVDALALLSAADEALYLAKQGGRNRVQLAQTVAVSAQVPGRLLPLVWHQRYESGNLVIDSHHHRLFSEANRILDVIVAGRGVAEIAQHIDDFVADIAEHFREEEVFLHQTGYPGAVEHARLHRELLDQAHTLAVQFKGGQLLVGELFVYLTQEVVARHMLTADREFIVFLHPAQ
ncbi:diguanylate cyclase [Rhodoferax sp. BLA1]|uniref:diguanylate cyclase n=1 Tax=Rhodoferax sp. BLA1 TaxID=2576062 RepID=UPI0015D1052D|nr:diguanylate cyclase [Rhodoferax sp. BLA1]